MVTERNNYVNIREILSRVTEHPLMKNVTLDAASRYILEFIRLVGLPKIYIDKIVTIDINEYKGLLPCDLVSIIQVRESHSKICMRSMTDSFPKGLEERKEKKITGNDSNVDLFADMDRDDTHKHYGHDKDYEEEDDSINTNKNDHRHFHRNNVDIHHKRHNEHYTDKFGPVIVTVNNVDSKGEYTFKTQGDIIYTSFREGSVDIAYKSLPIDDDGLPLLIDNEVFLLALELYIKKKIFTVLYDTRKIDVNILNNVKQDYAMAVGQCKSEFLNLSISEVESFTRMWTTLVQRVTDFDNGFKNLGSRERLRDR